MSNTHDWQCWVVVDGGGGGSGGDGDGGCGGDGGADIKYLLIQML